MEIKPEVMLNVSLLHFDEENTNEQDDVTFNALVEQIQESGFTENIVVVDHTGDPNWKDIERPYMVISGNHRGRAAEVLGMEQIPARVWTWEEWDDDYSTFQNIRHNVLKGKLNPVKFTKMFTDLAAKYGEQATKDMMMFMDEEAFKKVYMDSTSQLPKELRDQLDKSKKDIKTVDDLSNLLNTLFSTYGDTLAHDYMVFDYGGRSHIWIRMDEKTKKKMDDIKSQVMVERVSMNELFKVLLEDYADDVMPKLERIDSPDIGDLN